MPLYEFRCLNKKCGVVYEALTAYDETEKYKDVKCPDCGGKKKERLMSTCSFSFKNPVGTGVWNSSHDYRFKWNLPRVKKEREAAEKAAKGKKAYNPIDDINKGDNFGKVK
jgi:putative FmdB family regulatory protein